MSVDNGDTIYATELFGPGHSSPKYPIDLDPNMDGNQDGTPVVELTIPGNLLAQDADSTLTPPRAASPARNHDGSAEIMFMLTGGAVFEANITGLMYNANTGDDDPADATTLPVAASGDVASIMAGGRKGDNYVTIKVEEATAAAGTRPNTAAVAREENGSVPTSVVDHSISFSLPRLASLGHLAGANSTDMDSMNDMKSINITATATIRSGAFSDGLLTGTKPPPVINSRDAVTLKVSDKNEKNIPIDGEMAFRSVEGANKDGYVKLATVTIETMPIMTPGKPQKDRTLVGKVQATAGTDTVATDVDVYLPGSAATQDVPHMIYGMDGELIDEGLRGNLMVKATGTRDLFNEDDKLFIDYDGDKKPGAGEEMPLSGDMMEMAMSGALSIDPDKSESFNDAGVGAFDVYYKPGGKGDINHGAMINLTAMVDYSDPSAINENDKPTSTTLNLKGVGNAVMAYAIAQTDNGRGDTSNLRVRCEGSTKCRVFLECWGDEGTDTRGFGEVDGGVPANGVKVWRAAAIEEVTGRMPDSRHSCRILSKGMVTVQQLTRSEGVLVNNTYVGDGE